MSEVINKYQARVEAVNSLVCVGLDSNLRSLPEIFLQAGLPQWTFNQWIIEQTAAYATAFKPNIAFYEAQGIDGLKALKKTIEFLRQEFPDVITICDAKRADIGSTNEGYVEAIFDNLGFDAVTLHPYLGKEALKPFLDRKDKACIILCRTSNPGAREMQDVLVDGIPYWELVAIRVRDDWNENGNCMLVVGATYPKELERVRQLVGDMTLLVPGIGAQGGEVEKTVKSGLNNRNEGMIINSSRGIIFAGDPAAEAQALRDEINLFR